MLDADVVVCVRCLAIAKNAADYSAQIVYTAPSSQTIIHIPYSVSTLSLLSFVVLDADIDYLITGSARD